LEIAKIEQELISEGVSREEIQRLCEVHLAVFREQLEKQRFEMPPTGPIGILLEEHRMLQQVAQKLIELTERVRGARRLEDAKEELAHSSSMLPRNSWTPKSTTYAKKMSSFQS
jgi:DUF438 domain-containing protein